MHALIEFFLFVTIFVVAVIVLGSYSGYKSANETVASRIRHLKNRPIVKHVPAVNHTFKVESTPKSNPAAKLHTIPASIKEYRLPDGSRIAIDTDKVEISETTAF